MKLSQLKTGDKVRHYCCGVFVEAVVIEANEHYAFTKHRTVKYKGEEHRHSKIYKTSAGVNPAIFHNGLKIEE